jgi:hypothetical protein
MARPIDSERTGPGACKECGRHAKRRLNGWCRPCYDRLHKNNDPFARAAVQQKAMDKAPVVLSQIQEKIKQLWEDGIVTTSEHAVIQKLCQDAYDRWRSETSPELRQQYDEAIAELAVEAQRKQPQPDSGEPDLQNIPLNPNRVEVEDISNQPQPNPSPVEVEGTPKQPQPKGVSTEPQPSSEDEPKVA